MKYKILALKFIDAVGHEYLNQHDVEVIDTKGDSEAVWVEEIRAHQVDGIYCRLDSITPAMIDASQNLKVIAKMGAGLDNIDLKYATKKRIPVVYTPQNNVCSVAEHAVMLMIMCAKAYRHADHEMRKGNFGVHYKLRGTHELTGHTVGFIGCGRIGRAVANILVNGFGMKAIVYDPYLKPETVGVPVEMKTNRDEVFREADFITVHMQSLPSTRYGITYRDFSLMKPSAVFVNCARGDLIVEEDLIRALQEGKLAAAGLDVFERDELDPDDPLLSMDNVILTPHMAATTDEANYRGVMTACREIVQVFNGERVEFLANPF